MYTIMCRKISIKITLTCFGVNTPFVLTPKHVGVILTLFLPNLFVHMSV